MLKEFLIEELRVRNIESLCAYINKTKCIRDQLINETKLLLEVTSIAERIYAIINNVYYKPTCVVCNNTVNFKNFREGYRKYCSSKCVNCDPKVREKIKETSMLRYGVGNFSISTQAKEKFKQTCLLKYGVENPSQLAHIKSKKKQTCLKNFGVDVPSKSSIVVNKFKETCLLKYGVDNPSKLYAIKEKKKETCFSNLGVDNPSQSIDIQNKIRSIIFNAKYNRLKNLEKFNIIKPLFNLENYNGINNVYTWQCTKCSNIFEDHLDNGKVPRCYSCFPRLIKCSSSYEDTIKDWLLLNISNINSNNRQIISPLELDIYLPDYNLAIEFNGLYWHSEITDKSRCNKHYHLNKTKMCEEKGIQLIHIFEDEWIDKQEIVKSIIKNKLGLVDTKIYARKCEIKNVSQEEVQNFLFENHLQEPIYSKYNFGLYYNDELVYLICLSKPRFNKKYQFELIRSCSKINTQVIGGFDRLVKHAVKTLDIKSLISYVDRRYFNGSGYKNNWNCVDKTKPNYFYINCKNYLYRESRIKYQKHKLKKLFPEYYDDNLTEWQIMQLAGYDRIWDCGNLLFEYIF